jgi:alpha-galactosidase
MAMVRFLLGLGLALGWLASGARVEAGYENELNVAQQWFDASFGEDVSKLPFSFKLGEESSATVLGRAKRSSEDKQLDGNRTERTIVWADETTGLETKLVVVKYADYPNIEWTVRFTNKGDKDTPVLSAIEGLDVHQTVPTNAQTILHHMKGSYVAQNDFEPYEMGLTQRTSATFRSFGGRGTNGCWPYFNVNWGNTGLIVAIGWPGQWNASFDRDGTTGLAIRAGQENANFKLTPGETARTPLMVLQWYAGDWIEGQNAWRRWMVTHNVPRVDGKLPGQQLLANSSHQFAEMINANEENQKQMIDRYLEEKLPLAYWWMDAGWYVNDGNWVTTGTWEVDKKRFPNGLRAITDHAHSKGVKAIVWFEPERVAAGTWLDKERPQWLLSPLPNPGDQSYLDGWKLLNLGNPEALDWAIKHISGLIESEGIDLYRQDFNMDPLMYWRNGEAEDRQGITENHYVEGYLAYWDGLLANHPHLRIDTCSSGGRRLDLETLRRSVPLIRSDYLFEPIGQQGHTHGISSWVPYYGNGTLVGKSAIGQNTTEGINEYDFRSHVANSLTAAWDMRDKTLDYDKLRELSAEHARIGELYMGDYYPLTRHSISPKDWIAWEFNNPETGKGVVQAFRREENTQPTQTFRLRGLDPAAQYEIESQGSDKSWTESGAVLMDRGLEVKLEPRTADVLFLTKQAAK